MPVGTVLRAQHVEESFLLSEQFLHKALLIVLDGLEKGGVVAAVLNRPTAAVVRFNLPGSPSRRLPVCGTQPLPPSLATDGQGQLWLHHKKALGGTALGASRLFSMGGNEVGTLLKARRLTPRPAARPFRPVHACLRAEAPAVHPTSHFPSPSRRFSRARPRPPTSSSWAAPSFSRRRSSRAC